MNDDVFARAREQADISAVAGVKLHGQGRKRRGPCPLCGHGDKAKSGFAFEVDTKRNSFRCFACDEKGGSVIDLEFRLHATAGETLFDVAKRLAGDTPARPLMQAARPAPVILPDRESFAERFAKQIWAQSQPATGSLAHRYLRARGIAGAVLIEALKHLRFHPNVYHSGPEGRSLAFPAMVAQVVTAGPGGQLTPTGGIHVTYLARDGGGKAYIPNGEKAKKMWGPQTLNGCPGGVWLCAPEGEGPVVVAEGIESALSMAMLNDGPCRPVAALSLGRLSGGHVQDKWGRFDPDMPQSDPERPGFTWPVVGSEVIIGVDHDMSPLRVKVRKMGGGTATRILDATERARLSASLAKAMWKRAGWPTVFSVMPLPGEDFNDRLKKEIGQ